MKSVFWFSKYGLLAFIVGYAFNIGFQFAGALDLLHLNVYVEQN